jgi:peptidoglycan/xylan/chitin deacetylase (PgdA/CDA1 family)
MKDLLLTFDLEEFVPPIELGIAVDRRDMFELGRVGLNSLMGLLARHRKIRATFFTTAEFAEYCPELIRRLAREGHEIALHGFSHSDDYSSMPGEKAEARLARGKEILERISGSRVSGFRAPQMKRPGLGVLRKIGLDYDSSSHPTLIPGFYNKLAEQTSITKRDGIYIVPASVLPVLRLPFSWFFFRNFGLSYAKICTQITLAAKGYASIYFHPWEFTNVHKPPFRKTFPFRTRNTGEKLINKLEKYVVWSEKKGCRFIAVKDYLSDCAVKKHFDAVAGKYDASRKRGLLGAQVSGETRQVLSALAPSRGEDILDAGCGAGFYSRYISSAGANVYGIDISSQMMAQYSEKGLLGRVADIENFKLNKAFDKILCAGAMEFLSEPASAIKCFREHLKCSGKLVVLYPRESLAGSLYAAYHKKHAIDLRLYAKKNMEALLIGAKFRILMHGEVNLLTNIVVAEKCIE